MTYRSLDISVFTRLSSGIHPHSKRLARNDDELASQSETGQQHKPWNLTCPLFCLFRIRRHG